MKTCNKSKRAPGVLYVTYPEPRLNLMPGVEIALTQLDAAEVLDAEHSKFLWLAGKIANFRQ